MKSRLLRLLPAQVESHIELMTTTVTEQPPVLLVQVGEEASDQDELGGLLVAEDPGGYLWYARWSSRIADYPLGPVEVRVVGPGVNAARQGQTLRDWSAFVADLRKASSKEVARELFAARLGIEGHTAASESLWQLIERPTLWWGSWWNAQDSAGCQDNCSVSSLGNWRRELRRRTLLPREPLGPVLPTELNFSIGIHGRFPPDPEAPNDFRWEADRLFCYVDDPERVETPFLWSSRRRFERSLQPRANEWEAFWKMCDELELWSLPSDVMFDFVRTTTAGFVSYELKLAVGDREVESSGIMFEPLWQFRSALVSMASTRR